MSSRISLPDLTARLSQSGFPDAITARNITTATLRVLGERFTDDEARLLTEALTAELADIVDRSEYEGDFDALQFYERARQRMKMPAGTAHEAVQVVLRALGELLDGATRTRLARALPAPLGEQMTDDVRRG